MSAKHTQQAWKVGSDEPFVYALNAGGSNRFFAAVQGGWEQGLRRCADDKRTSHEELMANARLIVAAPDLLDALVMAQAHIAMLGGTPDPTDEWADQIQIAIQKQIREAIAKATGGAA